MLTNKEQGLLINIIKHCKKINEKMNNLTREQFDNDEDVVQIICFNILQIGELAKNFEPKFVAKYSGVPWRQIKGMRDKVAHGYGTIDKERVWKTALNDINPLLNYCQKILDDNSKGIISHPDRLS